MSFNVFECTFVYATRSQKMELMKKLPRLESSCSCHPWKAFQLHRTVYWHLKLEMRWLRIRICCSKQCRKLHFKHQMSREINRKFYVIQNGKKRLLLDKVCKRVSLQQARRIRAHLFKVYKVLWHWQSFRSQHFNSRAGASLQGPAHVSRPPSRGLCACKADARVRISDGISPHCDRSCIGSAHGAAAGEWFFGPVKFEIPA